MVTRAKRGFVLVALLLLGGCNKSDTDMTEAYWCASYGTCKPSAPAAVQPAAAVADCSYYGTCGQQQEAPAAYDACAFYGICDRGSL